MLVDLFKDLVPLRISPVDERSSVLISLLLDSFKIRRVEARTFDPLRAIPGDADGLLAAVGVLKKAVYDLIEERQLAVPSSEMRFLADWFVAVTDWALRVENRRFAAMLDALPDQIFLKDTAGRYLYLNRTMARTLGTVTGLSPDALVGLDPAKGSYPESFKRYIADLDRRVLQGEVVTEEFQLPGSLAESLGMTWREHHLAPVVDSEGRIEGIAVASRDIQARKTAEANVARARDELAQAVAFRESVMAVLGHDLRNPLSSVLSLSELLQGRDVSERVREGLAHIRSAAERMEEMIGAVLDVTQVRLGGGFELRYERVELEAVARAVIDELRAAHRQRAIALKTAGAVVGRWDRGRIAQVLSNLVGNALTHGAPDAPVHVDLSVDDANAVVAVSNSGPAIPPEQIDHLFEPFRRGPAKASSRSGGLGLGLFIVREIVSAHGGTVDVSSDASATTFTIRLPSPAEQPAKTGADR